MPTPQQQAAVRWACRKMRYRLRADAQDIASAMEEVVESLPRRKTLFGGKIDGFFVAPYDSPARFVLGRGDYNIKKDRYTIWDHLRIVVTVEPDPDADGAVVAKWVTDNVWSFEGKVADEDENEALRAGFVGALKRLDPGAQDLEGDAESGNRYFLA